MIRLVAVMLVAAAASPSPVPSASAAPRPAAVTRAFSDAVHYNQLQAQLLETQRDRIAAELARLEADKQLLLEQGKRDFFLDLVAGDSFDEKTLTIHRKATP